MPASSKAQQRFFGVVKAMQKGDKPKEGEAGKVAKSMKKKDVDDFASTKHKGKPEKVKREMKVRNLIKKMVREELAKMNEVRIPFSSSHIKQLKRAFKDMKGTLPDNNPLVQQIVTLLKKTDKKVLKQIASADIKYLSDKAKDILGEGTCGYGENGELGEEPAGPHLIKKKLKEAKETIFDVAARVMKDKQAYGYNTKKGLVTVDMQTANLLTKVFKKVNPKMKKILSDLGYKSPTQLMNTLWAVVKQERKVKLTKSKLKEVIREVLEEETINEINFDKIKLPSVVNRFLGKFVDSMKGANLNRMKRAAILYKVIDAAGMTPQQLMADIQKIKTAMKND